VFALGAIFNNFFLSAGFVVSGDPAATAKNILARESVFRFGIFCSFAELMLFIVLVVWLYGLFEAVDKKLSMIMVGFVWLGVALSLSNMVHKTAPLIYLGGADYLSAFSRQQLEALSQVSLGLRGNGNQLAMAFWGLWLLPFGLLVIRSGFIPKFFGIALLIAGVGYTVTSGAAIVSPAYRTVVSQFMTPLYFGELPIIFWLLLKGVRVPASGAMPRA
jgi:hypothetical protein